MANSMQQVIAELNDAVSATNLDGYSDFLQMINHDESKYICTGAGRVGLALRGFSMRLNHLGLNSFFLGETIVPRTGEGDVLVVGSGSGSTPSILRLVEIAKSKNLRVALITSSQQSPMRSIADVVVTLPAPNKTSSGGEVKSIQPMTTLFEQTLSIFLDAAVLDLMNKFDESSASMWARHNVIE